MVPNSTLPLQRQDWVFRQAFILIHDRAACHIQRPMDYSPAREILPPQPPPVTKPADQNDNLPRSTTSIPRPSAPHSSLRFPAFKYFLQIFFPLSYLCLKIYREHCPWPQKAPTSLTCHRPNNVHQSPSRQRVETQGVVEELSLRGVARCPPPLRRRR